jgi:uracil phosphoribosyltransferase
MVHDLSKNNSLVCQYMYEMRESGIQRDAMRFRKNLARMGNILAYEISRFLDYQILETNTPLGYASVPVIKNQPVVASILRAGLPLHNGLIEFFDKAENAFISAYRKHKKDGTFDVHVEYMACPDLNGKTLIIADPMLATGTSLQLTYDALMRRGKPSSIHVATVIASVEGVEKVRKNLPDGIHIWCGAIDEELTAQAYIVPGLGDAGDLAFGEKV